MGLTALVFLAIYASGIVMAFVRGPIWGLWTYMIVFYLHPPSRWWGVGLPPIRWALFAAIVTLAALVIHNARSRKERSNDSRPSFFSHGFAVFFALLVAWMWVQAPWVISPEHMDGVILFSKYLLMIYLFYSIVRTPEQIRDTLIVHIFGCMYLGWLAYQIGGGGRLEGVGGPGIDDSNSMAMQFGTAVAAGAGLMLREKLPRLTVLMFAMPLILNGMVLGNSRGAFLGLLGCGLVIWWLKPAAVRGRFLTFAGLAVCLFLALAHESFWERISTLGAVTDDRKELDNSAASRFVIVNAQLEMFGDYPLGAGHKGTAELSPNYMDERWLTTSGSGENQVAARSSHNTFMSVVVDHGIVGVVLLILILLWVFRTIRIAKRVFRDTPSDKLLLVSVTSSLAVVALAGMFAPYFKAEVQYWMLALLMCVAALPTLGRATNGNQIE